jgi:uncharacterized NAD(P)/FAD-binding protein YdhS
MAMTTDKARTSGWLAAGLALMVTAAVAAQSTTVRGTVEQVDKARVEVAAVDDHGKPAGKPAWYAVTDATKLTRGGKAVAWAEAHLKMGETVTVVVHAGDEAGTDWTCSMHPEVAEAKPGKCPKCAMTLKERARPAKAAELKVQ